jgi:ABC-type transport system substrate-binding protein
VSTDPEERKEIYGQIQMIIMNNALIIPIYEGTMSLAMNPKVKNIALDARVYYTWMHSAYVSE